jgi:hypothetical protein
MAETPARTVRRRKRTPAPDIAGPVQEYLLNRSMRERSSYHETDIKATLMDILAAVGVPDGDEGEHRMLLLEQPQEFTTYKNGKAKVTIIKGIQRQERKGRMSLNEDRTMAYLTKRKLLPSCTTTVTVINEDAILAANFEGTIPDDDLKALYDESDPTYAFYLIEE